MLDQLIKLINMLDWFVSYFPIHSPVTFWFSVQFTVAAFELSSFTDIAFSGHYPDTEDLLHKMNYNPKRNNVTSYPLPSWPFLCYRKFAEIFAARGAPPVSLIPARWCTLTCGQVSLPQIFEKILNDHNFIFRRLGEDDS